MQTDVHRFTEIAALMGERKCLLKRLVMLVVRATYSNHLDSSVWSEVSVWFTVYPMINFNYIKCSLWLMHFFFVRDNKTFSALADYKMTWQATYGQWALSVLGRPSTITNRVSPEVCP